MPALRILNKVLKQGVEKRSERWRNKARKDENSSRSDTVLQSIRCGKSGLDLLPQSAVFASNVSQMRFTGKFIVSRSRIFNP
jgi:hypothetical protein